MITISSEKVDPFKSRIPIEELLSSKGRVKIIKILAIAGELNISEIARRARLNHEATAQHLNFLKKLGLIQEKRFGRIKIYRFKIENMSAKILRNLFMSWDGS